MKKVLLLLVCAVSALTLSAQRASSSSSSFFSTEKVDGGVQFGVRAGLNFANVSYKVDGESGSYSPDSRTAWHVGFIADIPVVESFYVQTGLFFQNKGWKEESDGVKATCKPMYLEIPILASYRYNFSDAAQLQINFGPYFAYGVGGKSKAEYEGRSAEVDYFGDADDENDNSEGYKRFDFGLQVGGGVTFASHIYLGVAYEFGLVNTSGYDDTTVKNNNLMISVGYNF